jgi:hypothetical protein
VTHPAKTRRRTALSLVLVAACASAAVLASGGIPYPTLRREWSIGIYEGPSPFELVPAPGVANPVLSARDVTDVPARFVADPFLVARGGSWFMFFEVLDGLTGRGEIGYASSRHGRAWRYGRIVLAEPFHLSYPFVFTRGDAVYMVPESIGARSVRLYRAVDFPSRWTFERTLLSEPLLDPSIVFFEDRWWLFGAPTNESLCAFYADRLEGPWTAHARNPIVRESPHGARPGGRVFIVAGRAYRIAQDDAPNYGLRVFAFEMTTLTPTAYAERPARNRALVEPDGAAWSKKGIHTVDPHVLPDGRWLASVDGSRRALFLDVLRLTR